jgi:hypothetical protein
VPLCGNAIWREIPQRPYVLLLCFLSRCAVRASALNAKSLVYVNNIKFATNKGHKFTYVFSN